MCYKCKKIGHKKPCMMCKQTNSTRALQLIYTVVCGHVKPSTWDGKCYILNFIDYYTPLVVTYLKKTRSEFFGIFIEYRAMETVLWSEVYIHEIEILLSDTPAKQCMTLLEK